MVRRKLFFVAIITAALVCAAAPALAYAPLVGHTVFPGSKLAPGADPAVVVWAQLDGGTASLLAQRYSNADGPLIARTVVSGISGLDGWYAAGDGSTVTVVWKAGETIQATCIDLSSGATVYAPVTVCTDAAVATLPGEAASATLSGVAPDGGGGAYVWCTVTPSTGLSGVGDTLLNHLSASGVLAAADPGVALAKGTVAGLDVDVEGHAFALLAPPGRRGLGVQRFSPALTPDTGWSKPISPYSPLLPVPSATPQPIAITAGTGAALAWREAGNVKVQRYSRGGGIVWLSPPTVSMPGDVGLAGDRAGGLYLVGPSSGGIVARHILATGVEAGPASVLPVAGLSQPRVGALTVNRAGDLFAGYSDQGVAASSGIGLMTCLGAWSSVGPATLRPDLYSAAVPDGTGGAYLLGEGALWRVADGGSAAEVTLRPRSQLVLYGKRVTVAGYVTQADSLPGSGVHVAVTASGGGSASASDQAEADGYFHASILPKANATWTAAAAGASSEGIVIWVKPRVTLALTHLRPQGTRLTEIFSGAVTPNHAGARVLIKKAVGSGWRTVASGRLDSSSRYRVTWALPYRTASYSVRAVIAAHADHAEGVSPKAGLRVVIRKG
jgi:hypothetical protein